MQMLMRTNFARNVDGRTREKMVRAFWPRHPRTDKFIAARNWWVPRQRGRGLVGWEGAPGVDRGSGACRCS